jgi:hypothetical protein
MSFTLREAIDCLKNEGLCVELDSTYLQQLDAAEVSPADLDEEFDS